MTKAHIAYPRYITGILQRHSWHVMWKEKQNPYVYYTKWTAKASLSWFTTLTQKYCTTQLSNVLICDHSELGKVEKKAVLRLSYALLAMLCN